LAAVTRVSPLAIGIAFFKLSLLTYGGGQSAAIGDEVVRRRGWLTNEEFLTFRSIATLAPGANSPNLAVLVGRHLAGWPGALVAWLGATVPGCTIILIDPHSGLGAALRGCAAGAVGLMFANAIEMTHAIRPDLFRLAVIAATTCAVIFLNLSLWYALVVFVPLTILVDLRRRRPARRS
jgi:chromate transporter